MKEVTSSHSLLSGAGVRWLAAPPAELMVCAVHPTLQRSDPGFHLGYSGRFSWQPPRMHPQHSLHYKKSSRSYLGYTSAKQHRRYRQLAGCPHCSCLKQQNSQYLKADRPWGLTVTQSLAVTAIRRSPEQHSTWTPSVSNKLRHRAVHPEQLWKLKRQRSVC